MSWGNTEGRNSLSEPPATRSETGRFGEVKIYLRFASYSSSLISP